MNIAPGPLALSTSLTGLCVGQYFQWGWQHLDNKELLEWYPAGNHPGSGCFPSSQSRGSLSIESVSAQSVSDSFFLLQLWDVAVEDLMKSISNQNCYSGVSQRFRFRWWHPQRFQLYGKTVMSAYVANTWNISSFANTSVISSFANTSNISKLRWHLKHFNALLTPLKALLTRQTLQSFKKWLVTPLPTGQTVQSFGNTSIIRSIQSFANTSNSWKHC